MQISLCGLIRWNGCIANNLIGSIKFWNSLFLIGCKQLIFIVPMHSCQSIVTVRVMPLIMHYIDHREVYELQRNINKDNNQLFINNPWL